MLTRTVGDRSWPLAQDERMIGRFFRKWTLALNMQRDERPWYRAVSVSAAVHICLIIVASRLAFTATPIRRMAVDLESSWSPESGTPALEIADVSSAAVDLQPDSIADGQSNRSPSEGVGEVAAQTPIAQT